MEKNGEATNMLTLPLILYSFVTVAFSADYALRRRVPVARTRRFFCFFATQVLTMFCNLVSLASENLFFSGGGTYVRYLPEFAFLAAYMLRANALFQYETELLKNRRHQRPFRITGWLILAAGLIILLFNVKKGMLFTLPSMGECGQWTGRIPLWLSVIYYLLECVLFALVYRKLSGFRKIFLALTNVLLLCPSILLIFIPRDSAVGMFGICAFVFLYLAFEDPYRYLQPGSRVFNELAMELLMSEWPEERPLSLFAFRIAHYSSQVDIYGRKTIDACLRHICGKLQKRYRKFFISYSEGCVFVLREQPFDFEKMQGFITETLEEGIPVAGYTISLNANCKAVSLPSLKDIDDLAGGLKSELEELDSSGRILQEEPLVMAEKEIGTILDRRMINRTLAAQRRSDILMYLQPIVDAKTRALVGAEALMRIRAENGKILFPDEFIPIAEKDGSIHWAGEQVYINACRFYEVWADRLGLLWLNVNLSPVQCLDRNLPERFAEIALLTSVDPTRIHLEVTEESMIQRDKLIDIMTRMRKAGFRFSLDDYGSGFSNMSRFMELPLENVKLDKQIIWDYMKARDQSLTLIVQLLHETGCTVTAEGVENEEMADKLTEIGVDYLQGFYFSGPIPVEEFIAKYRAG